MLETVSLCPMKPPIAIVAAARGGGSEGARGRGDGAAATSPGTGDSTVVVFSMGGVTTGAPRFTGTTVARVVSSSSADSGGGGAAEGAGGDATTGMLNDDVDDASGLFDAGRFASSPSASRSGSQPRRESLSPLARFGTSRDVLRDGSSGGGVASGEAWIAVGLVVSSSSNPPKTGTGLRGSISVSPRRAGVVSRVTEAAISALLTTSRSSGITKSPESVSPSPRANGGRTSSVVVWSMVISPVGRGRRTKLLRVTSSTSASTTSGANGLGTGGCRLTLL